ncbi:POU domain, class 6, transcription factor 2 [Drosophila biarmipes]|uniref:POU domain, class 6, transcription factor 2 n=1 Tax=Drosophila biarmipes TaxID=125945 RepID=UPI0007E6FE03|nr:POU domain, class 6, transcription factor 2 [Drosophila biarmipes]
MGTPHVCFADEQQPQHKTASDGSLNNNNNKLDVGYNNTTGNGTPSPGGSLSVSPTPRYERNLGFFRQLSRRFGLRSQDDLVQSSSDDAASVATSTSGGGGAGGGTGGVAGVTLQEEDAHSSSTDSCSSGRGLSVAHQSRLELMSMSCASSETSSTLDIEEQQEQLQQQQEQVQQQSKRKPISRASFSRLHRRSTSSLRRAFESLSLTSRSLSCSGPSPPPPAAHPPSMASGQPAAPLPLKSALKSASNVELHRQQQQHLQQHHHQHHAMGKSSSSSCSSVAKGKVKPPPQRILRQPVSYTYLKGMSGLPTQRVPRSSVCCQYARR